MEYDFKYKMEMATDVQLLVLSEGKSNILPADVIVQIPQNSNKGLLNVGENDKQWRLKT